MRNILIFILFLIGLFYVRRALRGKTGGAAPGREDSAAGASKGGEGVIEQMVACEHCGLHVPESEGVRASGHFFCSDEHRRLGSR